MAGRSFGFRVSPAIGGDAHAAAPALTLSATHVANAAPINVAVARVSGGSAPYSLTDDAGGRFAIQSDGIIRRTATALGVGPHTIAVNGTDFALTVLPAGELVALGSASLKGPNAAKRQAIVAHIGDSTTQSGVYPIDEYTRRWDGKTLVWFRDTAVADGLYAAVEPLSSIGVPGGGGEIYTGPLGELWRTFRRIAPAYVFDDAVEYVMYQYAAPGSGFSTEYGTPGNWRVAPPSEAVGDRFIGFQNRLDACLATVANSYLDTVVISLGSNDAVPTTVKLPQYDLELGGTAMTATQFEAEMLALTDAIRAKYGSNVKIVLSDIAPNTSGDDPTFTAKLDDFPALRPFVWTADVYSPFAINSTGVHYDDQDDQNELSIRLATAARLAETNNLAGSLAVPAAPVLTLTPTLGEILIEGTVPANNGGRILFYELQASADAASGWAALPAFVLKPSTSGPACVEDGLGDTETRYYRGRAVNIAGAGAWSAVVSATSDAGFDPAVGLVNRLVVNSGGTAITDTAGGATVTVNAITYDADAGAPNGFCWTSSAALRTVHIPITPTASFSYAAWVNPSSVVALGGIVTEGRASGTDPTIMQMYATATGRTWGGVAGNVSAARDPDPLVVGQWDHMVLTYDDTSKVLALYRNGVQIDTDTLAGNVRDLTATRLITAQANNATATTNAFRGSISSLRRYDKALSGSEVAALHGLGRGGA